MSEYRKVLELFDEEIIKPEFFPDAVWTYSADNDELYWNTDCNLDHLENGYGETYSVDYVMNYISWSGYSLFTVKTGFGDVTQIILKDANRHG